MWSPTHIQVTVQKAKGVLTKGKNGTNNCFVTIGLGKEKYQTSVKEKSTENVEWHEECELTIPDQGNRAELVLTCLHRNNLSIDEFLGQVTLPLNEMDVYDRPRSKWHKLESKPGKEKKKERGELEVRISFIVKSGSLTNLTKKEKNKSSIGQLASSVGGSLLSIGTLEKRKGLKKFAKSIGSKMHINSKKKGKDADSDSFSGSFASIGTPNSGGGRFGQRMGDADPGVISEDEDEFVFDNLSHKSSGSSLNIKAIQNQRNHTPSPLLSKEDANLRSRTLPPPLKPPRNASDTKLDEWESKLYGKHLEVGSTDSLKRRSWENSRVPLPRNDEEEMVEEEQLMDVPLAPPAAEQIPEPNLVKEIKREQPETPPQANTAPSTPVFQKSKENSVETVTPNSTESALPKPMPRSATMENLIDNNRSAGSAVKERTDKKQRFTNKLKYFKREKPDAVDDSFSNHKANVSERIIIGHENNFLQMQDTRRTEVSPELAKKYDGKSREELMLIANGMEHEVLIQRNRVKELEDYLDNLLLRVMETHPKILQNPYSRTTSTKSYMAANPLKNLI